MLVWLCTSTSTVVQHVSTVTGFNGGLQGLRIAYEVGCGLAAPSMRVLVGFSRHLGKYSLACRHEAIGSQEEHSM